MKRVLFLFAAAVVVAVAAGPAAASEACLAPSQITSWNNLGKHDIVVRTTRGTRFRLELASVCLGLRDAISLQVSSRGVGVCVEEGDYISYRYSGFGEQRCMITRIAPYVPEEEPDAAAPSGGR
jgi:Family of unknown function (DUF6491)